MVEPFSFNMILIVTTALLTVVAILYTLMRQRITKLDRRVRLFLFGIFVTWTGFITIPFLTTSVAFISSGMIVIGSLITVQILLEWKYGRMVWLKFLGLILLISLLIFFM